MKQLTSILGVLFLFASVLPVAIAQESQDENRVFVVYFLTPKNDKISAFEKAWKSHNAQFHKDSPVYAFYVETGPYGGSYEGVEGPNTWTEHENYEYSDAHGKDWLNNVQPLLDGKISVQWWKHMPKYDQNTGGDPTEKSIVSVYHVKNGQGARFMRLLDNWHEANTEQNYDGRYSVYQRQLHGSNQIAIVGSLEKGLAEYDDTNEFKKRYTDTHGESAWQLFLDDYELSVHKSTVTLRNRLTNISTPQN